MPTIGIKLASLGTPAPAAPVLSSLDATADGVVLTFAATAGTEIRVYLASTLVATLAANATTYTDLPAPGTQYSYRVVAYDAATGKSSTSASQTVTRPKRSAPSVGFTATATPMHNLLEWNAETVSGWRVLAERSLDRQTIDATGQPATVPETIPETINLPAGTLAYTDTASLPGRETRYYLSSIDAQGYESERALVRATRPLPPTVEEPDKPAAPEVFTATYSGTSIVIVYSATHPVRISRRDAGGSAYVLLATDTATPFTDAGIDPAKGYDYQFETFDGELASAPVTIQARPVPVVIVVTGNIHVDAD
ncbi:MAG TPA: hypothetical protein VGN72_06500, partial [Tepidisphaeraceae bacterium]|nr:hypothetical protein [Tepidisphaeraceae bacterium]